MVRSFLAALAALGCLVINSSVRGADDVRVETRDGRTLRGVVDARSDEASLWLRHEEDRVVLVVPVAWEEVASATAGGQAIAVEDLRENHVEMATVGPALAMSEVAKPQAAATAAFVAPRTARVRNLEIVGAGLVNLDRDVEPDGLSVTIVAVADDGLPVAVRGGLRAELHGQRRSAADPAPRFAELARWTQRVGSEDFVDGAATYCLPFRTVAPEWEFDILPDAVLTVQLGASGHGNYSASAPVVLRHFNPLRDELQQWEGTRFLPNELRGRFDHALSGRATQGLWQWWGR